MPLEALAQTILTFVAIVSLGAVLRLVGVVARDDARVLNAVIIYVGLPAFIFQAVHGASVDSSVLAVVGVAWVVTAVTLGAAWLVGKALRLERPRFGAVLLTAALGNTGYIGYPLTAALLGTVMVPTAVFYDVFGTVFALVLVGLPIAARFGESSSATLRNPLVELVRFPAVPALLVALLLRPVSIPEPVSAGLGLLASMVAPLIMLSVGISLAPRAIVHGASALAGVVGVRLLLAPAVALGAATILGLSGAQLQVTLLEASMPTMMLTFAVGQRFGLDEDFAAAAVFVTTALSVVTIPLVQLLAA